MSDSDRIRLIAGRSASLRVAVCVVLTLMLAAGDGLAQYRVDQGGRLLDANPALNAGRYNYTVSRPMSPLIGGNPFATGNMGRGLSLRSVSPIGSPTALQTTLGSGFLSSFIRDSVSVGDAASPSGGLLARPFFDPARTAPTASYLRGFYDSSPFEPTPFSAGTNAPGAMLPYGSPPRQRVDSARVLEAPFEGVGAPLNMELSSTIFGLEPLQLPGPLSSPFLQPRATYLPDAGADQFPIDERQVDAGAAAGPLDLRVWPESRVESPLTPLDVLRQERAIELFAERAPTPPDEGPDGVPDGIPRPGETFATQTTPGITPLGDSSMLPGSDVFTDMQLALALLLDPQAEWYTEMQEAADQSPTRTVEMQSRAVLAAEEFIAQVLRAPMKTFVGEGASALNDELRQAETAMDLGRYYDAVRHYERARVIDPLNPLPLIGKGHALLAAGEYVSAALHLVRGLERYPELTHFQVDLTGLMGGGEIVDIRRSDLMKLLARNEDPQLRFLLGYLEIHSGNRELGLQNLDAAARQADPGSLIRRYPDMIRRKGVLPAPKLAPEEIQDATAGESHAPGSAPPPPGEDSE
jgi:hypothetical protein